MAHLEHFPCLGPLERPPGLGPNIWALRTTATEAMGWSTCASRRKGGRPACPTQEGVRSSPSDLLEVAHAFSLLFRTRAIVAPRIVAGVFAPRSCCGPWPGAGGGLCAITLCVRKRERLRHGRPTRFLRRWSRGGALEPLRWPDAVAGQSRQARTLDRREPQHFIGWKNLYLQKSEERRGGKEG